MSARYDYSADCWRGWVWHRLTCRVECDGRVIDGPCECACHRPRTEKED